MNAQQKKFCEEYVKNGLNGKQAYLAAYKSCKKESTAEVNASKLLRNTKVQEYISQLQSESRSKAVMSVTERKEWLSSIIDGSQEQVTIVGVNEDGEQVREWVPVKMKERLSALDLLNKLDGSYTENVNIKGKIKTNSILEDIAKQLAEDD